MGFADFQKLQAKRKKKDEEYAAKPILIKGSQAAPDFSRANIAPPPLHSPTPSKPDFTKANIAPPAPPRTTSQATPNFQQYQKVQPQLSNIAKPILSAAKTVGNTLAPAGLIPAIQQKSIKPLIEGQKQRASQLVPKRANFATEDEYKKAVLSSPITSLDPTGPMVGVFAGTIKKAAAAATDDLAKPLSTTQFKELVYENVFKALRNLKNNKNVRAASQAGRTDFGNVVNMADDVRLDELIEKAFGKTGTLADKEIQEAVGLLRKAGIETIPDIKGAVSSAGIKSSKPSKVDDISISKKPIGKGGASVRSTDTSVPFDAYNAPRSSPSIPKELEPLAAEAKKYKSAEEFVKAQGEQGNWSKLQKQNPDLFKSGILRKSQSPQGAVGEIPANVSATQHRWHTYGQYEEVPAKQMYEGGGNNAYKDSTGKTILDADHYRETGILDADRRFYQVKDEWDELTQNWKEATISNQRLKDELIDAFATKEGQTYLNKVIAALPKNPDGTITAYRIGVIGGDGPQSYTLSEGMAKTFSHQGTDIPLPGTPGLPKGGYKDFGALPANVVKIDPKGIKAWSPYDAEILVESKYITTKSQLTDFYNKVKGGSETPPRPFPGKEGERGFIKNPFFRSSTPPEGTEPRSFPPSKTAPQLPQEAPLTHQEIVSLSQDIKSLKVNPEVNLSKLDISSKGKQLIKQVAENIRPKLEEVIGSPLTNKEVIERAQYASNTFKGAITKEQTKKWEVALTATRQKLAALAETGVVNKDFVDTLVTVRSVASDAGRKLQSFAVEAKPSEIGLKQYLIENLLDLGHKADDIIKAAEGVDFNNLQESAKFYRKFVKPNLREMTDLLRYNSMLTSPLTHIVNVSSNLLNSGLVAPIEKAVLGGVDLLSSTVTGSQRKYFVGESGAYLKAYAGAAGEATQKFIASLKGELATTNLDLKQVPLFPSGGVGGLAEKVLGVPLRFLEATDQFFMALGNAAETASLNYARSKGAKLSDTDILLQAADKAAYRVFRQDIFPDGQGGLLNSIDFVTQKLFEARNSKIAPVAWTARLSFPFIKTPTNIFKQGIEYSPAGYFTMIGAANKSEQLAKAVMGTTVATLAAWYATNNRLTWAEPTNEQEKNAFKDAGMQPYAIKLGDTWVQYQKLSPVIAFPISMIALIDDAVSTKKLDESTGELILRAVAKYGEFLADQSYAKSFGDLLAAFNGEESSIARLASNYPQQFVPYRALGGWLARLTDDIQRKPDPEGTFVEKQVQLLMMSIPGLSQSVPARENARGEPIKLQNNVVNSFSPVRTSTEDADKREDFDDIKTIRQLEREAVQRNSVIKDMAEDIVIELGTLSRGEQLRRLLQLKKDNPALYEKVQDLKDQDDYDYSTSEQVLKNASSATRAQMIADELKGLSSRDKTLLLLEYKKKKILTPAVKEKLQELGAI